jgi:hypothetical protein
LGAVTKAVGQLGSFVFRVLTTTTNPKLHTVSTMVTW